MASKKICPSHSRGLFNLRSSMFTVNLLVFLIFLNWNVLSGLCSSRVIRQADPSVVSNTNPMNDTTSTSVAPISEPNEAPIDASNHTIVASNPNSGIASSPDSVLPLETTTTNTSDSVNVSPSVLSIPSSTDSAINNQENAATLTTIAPVETPVTQTSSSSPTPTTDGTPTTTPKGTASSMAINLSLLILSFVLITC